MIAADATASISAPGIPDRGASEEVDHALAQAKTPRWPAGRPFSPSAFVDQQQCGRHLILADEPTAALDSVSGGQVMERFAKVAHEQNAGVIVVTHDYRALSELAHLVSRRDYRKSQYFPAIS